MSLVAGLHSAVGILIKSRQNEKWVMSGQKLGHKVILKNHAYNLEGIVLIQSSLKFVRIFIFMKSRPE